METLYSTGMRRAEITSLRVDDVDLNRGTVFVHQGKGAKDRVVPIGERACRWIERYLFKVRLPSWWMWTTTACCSWPSTARACRPSS